MFFSGAVGIKLLDTFMVIKDVRLYRLRKLPLENYLGQ